MNAADITLSDLAAATGLEPRLIRSWVAQGLLPGPVSRGPGARYPAPTLERLLAILGMRDELGMPLAEIRRELLVATPEQIAAYAARGAARAGRRPASAVPPANPSSALDYLRQLRARGTAAAEPPAALFAEAPPLFATGGFEALEQRLGGAGDGEPARKARAEDWLRLRITPDVELAARGPLDPAQRARLERCADLIRDILLGKS